MRLGPPRVQLFSRVHVLALMPHPFLLRLPASISIGLCLALVAGCSSDTERPAKMPAVIPEYPTVMSGTGNFADGKVVVEVTLGLPTDFRPGKEGGKSGGSGADGGSHSGHHGGGRHSGGTGGSGYPGGSDGAGASGDDSSRPALMGSTLPPAQLKLHLRNTSSADAVACEVVDFNSSLGNFAVFPSRYQIEAGQSATSEMMTSRLGVEGSDIPVTVALRIHDQVERQVIALHLLPVSDQPAPTPPVAR